MIDSVCIYAVCLGEGKGEGELREKYNTTKKGKRGKKKIQR